MQKAKSNFFIWFAAILLFCFSSLSIAAPTTKNSNQITGDEGDSHQKFWEWYFKTRSYPGKTIPRGAKFQAWRQFQTLAAPSSGALSPINRPSVMAVPLAPSNPLWASLGPGSISGGYSTPPLTDDGGIRFFTVDPSNANHWLLCGFTGGIWESKDAGNSWAPRTDAMPSLGGGAIAFAPGSPNVVYAATDDDGSGGILKSTDGGTTWQFLAASGFLANQNTTILNEFKKMYVDPNNANTVMVALSQWNEPTNYGIWKSTDGGNTWTEPLNLGSVRGYEVQSGNFNNQYASVNQQGTPNSNVGLYRTTDAGTTWNKVAGPWDSQSPGVFRIVMAPSNGNVLYVYAQNTSFTALGFFMSTNAWAATPTWTSLPVPPTIPEDLLVDPSNTSVVYGGWGLTSDGSSVSRFNGTTWTNITSASNGLSVHPDVRALGWAGSQLFICDDGGLFGTTSPGSTWTSYNNNGLVLTEFYRGSVKRADPSMVMGGTQDNGTPQRADAGTWSMVSGGDGQSCFFGAVNPLNQAYSSQGLAISRSINGGPVIGADGDIPVTNGPFFTRFENSPFNDDVVIVGSNGFLYKTTDFFSGATVHWAAQQASQMTGTPICEDFAPSDTTGNTYVFGMDNGQIWLTTNGGTSWNQAINNGLPNRQITGLAFDPGNSNILYAVLSGFNANTAGFPGHVFKTTNALSASPTWTNISDSVDVPHNTITVDPNAPSNLYVGTDLGVLASSDGGSTWSQLGPSTGMPNVIVTDLRMDKTSGTLTAFTYGRGAFQLQTGSVATYTPTPTVTATPTIPCGTTRTVLQLKEFTTCAANQSSQTFEVINTGTSPVNLSQVTIKFWADDTTGQPLVGAVNYGGCYGSTCTAVSGVAISAGNFSPACGPDSTHQANWEVTVSTTDGGVLNAGVTWASIQTAVHLGNFANFTPGTVDWYSPCGVGGGSAYTNDLHYAVYYQGNLVTASGGVPPSCRGLATCTPSGSTVTPTATPTRTATATMSPTFTVTTVVTSTPTSTSTKTPTSSATSTPTNTSALTLTATLTRTFTFTPTISSTPAITSTPTPTRSSTATFTATRTSTPSSTPTVTLSPTPTPGSSTLRLQFKAGTTADPTNNPGPQFRLFNDSTTAVDLTKVEIRYWYTEEGTSAQQVVVDWAGRQPSGTTITPFLSPSIQATTQGSQTNYVRYLFNSGVGVLNPGEDVEIQSRFNKTDWSNYTQANDWSYTAFTSFTNWTHLTAYLNGVKVWGQEPGGAPAAAPLQATLLNAGATVPSSGELPLVVAAPNVSRNGEPIQFRVNLSQSVPIHLALYSLTGEKVVEMDRPGSTGLNTLTWSLQTTTQENVASGLYIYVLKAGTMVKTGKIVLVH